MATTVQFRRANTANTLALTGAVGEITIDTDKDVVVVHDGSTAGGHAMAREVSPTLTGNVTVGNSSVNVVANSSSIKISNSTVNTVFTLPTTTQYANNGFFLHANGTWAYIDVNGTPSGSNTQIQFNDSGEFGTNSLFTFDKATSRLGIGSNVAVNTSTVFVGNTITNVVVTSSSLAVSNTSSSFSVVPNQVSVGNSTVNATVTSTILSLGNTTVNASINSSSITVSTANITSNTLTLGTSTNDANGYTYLPNGFKLNWGWVSANDSVGDATFASAFGTSVFSVTATSNTAETTYQAAVTGMTTTTAQIRTANTTATNVFYMAIGV